MTSKHFALVQLLGFSSYSVESFSPPSHICLRQQSAIILPSYSSSLTTSSTRLYRQPSKWDLILDDDDDVDEDSLIQAPPDMKYVPRNVQRQHQNFVAIREAGGPELTHDVYVPEPNTQVFWFVGKVARISDISVEQAVARQWPLIVQHAANLRPIELFPSRGHLEIWIAPGDTELDVAYNRPDVVFQKMSRDVEGASTVKTNLIGFQGEVYEKGQGMGFRTWRTEDGKPAKPEIQTPQVSEEATDEDYSQEMFDAPSEEDLEKLRKALEENDMNIADLYDQQQAREGKNGQEELRKALLGLDDEDEEDGVIDVDNQQLSNKAETED